MITGKTTINKFILPWFTADISGNNLTATTAGIYESTGSGITISTIAMSSPAENTIVIIYNNSANVLAFGTGGNILVTDDLQAYQSAFFQFIGYFNKWRPIGKTVGVNGIAGAQGSPGNSGDPGPSGSIGAQGIQGAMGAAGAIGSSGSQGSPGPAGPASDPGPAGNQGPQGQPGFNGDVGATG